MCRTHTRDPAMRNKNRYLWSVASVLWPVLTTPCSTSVVVVGVHTGSTRQPIVRAFFILFPGIEARLLQPCSWRKSFERRRPRAKRTWCTVTTCFHYLRSARHLPQTTHTPSAYSKPRPTVAGLSDRFVYAVLQHIFGYVCI